MKIVVTVDAVPVRQAPARMLEIHTTGINQILNTFVSQTEEFLYGSTSSIPEMAKEPSSLHGDRNNSDDTTRCHHGILD